MLHSFLSDKPTAETQHAHQRLAMLSNAGPGRVGQNFRRPFPAHAAPHPANDVRTGDLYLVRARSFGRASDSEASTRGVSHCSKKQVRSLFTSETPEIVSHTHNDKAVTGVKQQINVQDLRQPSMPEDAGYRLKKCSLVQSDRPPAETQHAHQRLAVLSDAGPRRVGQNLAGPSQHTQPHTRPTV